MRKRELLKLFFNEGWIFLAHGANHDIIAKGTKREYIPRHREINEQLAKALIKKNNLKGGK